MARTKSKMKTVPVATPSPSADKIGARIAKYTQFDEWPQPGTNQILDDQEKSLRAAAYLLKYSAGYEHSLQEIDLQTFAGIMDGVAKDLSVIAARYFNLSPEPITQPGGKR